jgi:hypothetical protein
MKLKGKTLVLDVDSTVFPLNTALGEHTKKHFTYDDIHTWDTLYDLLGGPKKAQKAFLECMTYEKMMAYGTFDYAVKAVQKFKAEGARIVIMTDRNPACRRDLMRWLKAQEIPHDRVYCGRLNKIALCKREKAWMIIDDKPETIERAREIGLHVATLKWNYNHEIARKTGAKLAKSWRGLERIVHNLAAA